jgi:hypothetical protein
MAVGPWAAKREFPVQHEAQGAKRRRPTRKAVDPLWQELAEPTIEYRQDFPEGDFVETRNGVRQPEGSLRFVAGADIYTDGSAKYPGASLAAASCSAVQVGPDGVERAVQVALPKDWPRSAVAAEMFAIGVALMILARGRPDGSPHEPHFSYSKQEAVTINSAAFL